MDIKRDEKGRFVKGTARPKSPGRPPRHVEQDYLDVTIGAVSLDDWRAVVLRALKDAKAGNGYARAWLADYLIGKPPQILDIRAGDAKLLEQVIKRIEAVGMTPADVFNAMLAELAESESNA